MQTQSLSLSLERLARMALASALVSLHNLLRSDASLLEERCTKEISARPATEKRPRSPPPGRRPPASSGAAHFRRRDV